MFFPARCLPTNPPRWPAVGRGPRVTCARNPSSPDGAACSWKRRITVWGVGEGPTSWEDLEELDSRLVALPR